MADGDRPAAVPWSAASAAATLSFLRSLARRPPRCRAFLPLLLPPLLAVVVPLLLLPLLLEVAAVIGAARVAGLVGREPPRPPSAEVAACCRAQNFSSVQWPRWNTLPDSRRQVGLSNSSGLHL